LHYIITVITELEFYPWYFDPPTHGISNPPTHGILTPYPWYINPLSMVYWPLCPWYIDHPTHGISTPQPMVFWPPCPWNIEPPAHGISNPLLWYYELLSFGRNEGGFNLPWGGSKYNDKKLTLGSKYHMENWTWGQNIMKIDPGVNLPWGSKYHMTPVLY
jgi:hypothetical protein